jgi:hypothetical protein
MQKRKGFLLVICLSLLAVVVALILWAGRPRNDAVVTLAFAGFTNESVALVLATNSGLVPVELYAAIRQENVSMAGGTFKFRDGFAPPRGTGLPRVLRPRESLIVEVITAQIPEPWWTELCYQRRGFRERIYGWAWDSGNSTVQTLLNRMISGPDLIPVKCGLTNQPATGP